MVMQNVKKLQINHYIDIGLFLFLVIFPFVASPFRVELMSKCVVYIIFALSLDLLWGSTGLMNLGQAIFFGLGGYTLALSYAVRNGVPAFMTSFGVTELPWFMQILENHGVAFLMGMMIPGLVAAILGYFIFSSKVQGVFFSIITLALASLIELFFNNQQKYTGGANGISGLPRLSFGDHMLSMDELYYLVLGVAVLVYLFCRWLINSRFGMILRSIRENESRLQFLGFNPAAFKLVVFVISGMLAGLSGMLFIPVNSFISPTNLGVMFSTSVLVWLAVGGRGNLTGAMAGAFLINWMESLLSEQFGDVWQLMLGVVMLVVVLFFPKGFIGTMVEWQYHRRMHRQTLARQQAAEKIALADK